jgi:hypothetical protein
LFSGANGDFQYTQYRIQGDAARRGVQLRKIRQAGRNPEQVRLCPHS